MLAIFWGFLLAGHTMKHSLTSLIKCFYGTVQSVAWNARILAKRSISSLLIGNTAVSIRLIRDWLRPAILPSSN